MIYKKNFTIGIDKTYFNTGSELNRFNTLVTAFTSAVIFVEAGDEYVIQTA